MVKERSNRSFSEIQKEKIREGVAASVGGIKEEEIPKVRDVEDMTGAEVAKAAVEKKGESVIGIRVSNAERIRLNAMFGSKGYSLAGAYKAAMTYLRQDIELGKAIITDDTEIIRKA